MIVAFGGDHDGGRSCVRALLFENCHRDMAPILDRVTAAAMVFAAIYRSVLTRVLAALIVLLVVSPYSEPFATMAGTDFGGAGAVDVGGASKGKPSTQDALAAIPTSVFVWDGRRLPVPLIALSGPIDSRRSQRTILRL